MASDAAIRELDRLAGTTHDEGGGLVRAQVEPEALAIGGDVATARAR